MTASAAIFDQLVTFEMANNHQGSVAHGRRIVWAMAEVAKRHHVRAAVKLQLRDLDTFIRDDFRDRTDVKHVKRFLDTRLTRDDQRTLVEEIRAAGLLAACTPFDEESVQRIVELDFDILKIGSCSARDWPLLTAAAGTGLPIVCSTGGLTISDIDRLVSFFEHRGSRFALMHCVALYPTPGERMQLNQIEQLRHRFPTVPIGWSTHEAPDDTEPVQIAVAKGASLFERHVGLPTEDAPLNAYSSTPEQIDRWLGALIRARTLCGAAERAPPAEEEVRSLRSLERAVIACTDLEEGRVLQAEDVRFAFPREAGELSSGGFRTGSLLSEDVSAGTPLREAAVVPPPVPDETILKTAVHQVKGLLHEAGITLSSEFVVEYSHHYGVARFFETGAVLITCVDRAYVKKIIVQLPGQSHPSHFHRHKEETFQVLFGTLEVEVDGHRRTLAPGETVLVQPGVFHRFWTEQGCVFEELSTHSDEPSQYRDPAINALDVASRKTVVDHWGRFDLPGPMVA
jgi:N-acetylneuraminate synthase